MKKRASEPGFERQGAEAIPVESEEEMWKNRILGEDNPIQLHHTVMYLLGLGFALRGGRTSKFMGPWFRPSNHGSERERTQISVVSGRSKK